jgi:hypothetical protein
MNQISLKGEFYSYISNPHIMKVIIDRSLIEKCFHEYSTIEVEDGIIKIIPAESLGKIRSLIEQETKNHEKRESSLKELSLSDAPKRHLTIDPNYEAWSKRFSNPNNYPLL